MASLQDLQASVDALAASVNDAATRTSADLANLTAEVQALQGQNSPDLQPIVDHLNNIKAQVDAIDEATAPAPAPTDAPPADPSAPPSA